MTGSEKCGDCVHAKLTETVGQRTCHGRPPTVALAAGPDGRVRRLMSRPGVGASEAACGLFEQAEPRCARDTGGED